ncbi:MAG: polyamine ABC transporter substrate-binding protein [Steroidobacteraceae bacterium]
MRRAKVVAVAVLCIAACCASGCGGADSGARNPSSGGTHDEAKALNLYIWADYLGPDTISAFEKQTGIKVRVSYFDNNETLEARMLTGNSGFDVVVPTAAFLKRQVRSGAYLPLDKKRLPNLANLDPALMSRIEPRDPGNAHAVIYTWGTFGIGYNETMVAERLPGVALNSWRLIFDPAYAAKLAPCGINIIDDPVGTVLLALKYLGKNTDAPSAQDLADVEAMLIKIRPFVRNIDTSTEIEALANGDICITLGYNGDVVQARKRAKDANNGIKLDYLIPQEGSLIWFDLLAIPRDAPNVSNAYLFINYLLDPHVMADISDAIGFANANTAATPLLDASIGADTAIYPTSGQRQRLFLPPEETPELARAVTRLWQKFKTAQ